MTRCIQSTAFLSTHGFPILSLLVVATVLWVSKFASRFEMLNKTMLMRLPFCIRRRMKVLWDGMNKKKLTTLSPLPTSVSAIAFSQDGNEMAIASSYTHEEGDREHPQDEIFVRKMMDAECMPKEK
jgi:hypothetical protein